MRSVLLPVISTSALGNTDFKFFNASSCSMKIVIADPYNILSGSDEVKCYHFAGAWIKWV